MEFAIDDSSLLSNQDTNKFLVGNEFQISYTTIKDFTSWVNWNSLLHSNLVTSKDDKHFHSYGIIWTLKTMGWGKWTRQTKEKLMRQRQYYTI